MAHTSREIKAVLMPLLCNEQLNGIIYVAGGIVPYVYSGEESARTHSDIDIVAAIENMPIIRKYLKDSNQYDAAFDSLTFAYNAKQADYGLEVFIEGIPVNFAPFVVQGCNIYQRNFLKKELSGYDALLTATMEGISIDDYMTRLTLLDSNTIGTYTIEMVKCAKESSDREKDLQDIEVIDRLPVDIARYNRVKSVVEKMRIDVDAAGE